MAEEMAAFLVWSLAGCALIGLGLYALFAKKAIGFWANVKMFPVTDVKKYNRAMAKLFCIFGFVFILLGIPLLSEQDTAWVMLSSLGVMGEVIVAMAVYTIGIEKRYKKMIDDPAGAGSVKDRGQDPLWKRKS